MKNRTKYNENILAIALKKQAKLQRTVGTNWWFEESRICKVTKFVYVLAFIATMVTSFLVGYGVAYWKSRTGDANIAAAQGQFLLSLVGGCVFLIAAVIIRRNSKKIKTIETKIWASRISSWIVVLSSVFMVLAAYSTLILKSNFNEYAVLVEGSGGDLFSRYMQLIFYHVFPLFVLSLSSVLLHIMERYNIKEISYFYDKLISKIYKDYVEANPDYTEEMWLKHINEYKDDKEDDVPLKRSKKMKKRKAEKE